MSLILTSWTIQAQYDDVYYSASSRTKAKPVKTSEYSDYSNSSSTDEDYYDEESEYDNYDEDSYDNFDEYDYAYTHRIRRFHRPLAGRSFYDPFYLDPWNYDPFYYSSGFGFITPRIGAGFYSYSDFNRWNRFSRYNRFRYWDPWTYSYWSYDPFLFNRSSNYYWAGNSWCPSSWYSNRYYTGSNYWGNNYNGAYQPRYYTDKNVHFGPRTYGATTTSDRGPSRSSSRVFSDPGTFRPTTPDPSNRKSPRETQSTVVRERNVNVDRRNPTSDQGAPERVSPRMDDRGTVRERTQPSTPKTFRDYDNGQTDRPQTTRPSPRSNEDNFRERIRSSEQSPRGSQPQYEQRSNGTENERVREIPQSENPRFESPRSESPRNQSSRQQQTERFEAPRQQSPRYEAPRQQSPRSESPRQDSPRSNGGGSTQSSGSSNAGGGSRTSPRNQ